MNNAVKCYIYTRVSTAMQVDGFSLEAQKDKLRKYAALNDMEIVREYSDAGFSGKLMISVLSAVAEIERENIRAQTMAGREQKAREGKWNGGFAPYGYSLVDGELVVAEDEAEIIRKIFDRYIHTNDGVHGVAEYLNKHGYQKKVRQNGHLEKFSRSFVDRVLDNPVYMGKIAYGCRRTEKKIGTRNEMHIVEQSEFPVYNGIHKPLVSEEDWNLAQRKKQKRSFQRDAFKDPSHAHILSALIVCPSCGKLLYGNVTKAHSKDNKTRYYYHCRHPRNATGHSCSFRTSIDQVEIDKTVARVISAMVHDERFAAAIQSKIGKAINTEDLEKELKTLESSMRQVESAKLRMESQMDTLDLDDPHYDRKMRDLQRRYDEKYDEIAELEMQIEEVRNKLRNIRREVVTSDNIYKILLAFDEVYACSTEVEKKSLCRQ